MRYALSLVLGAIIWNYLAARHVTIHNWHNILETGLRSVKIFR